MAGNLQIPRPFVNIVPRQTQKASAVENFFRNRRRPLEGTEPALSNAPHRAGNAGPANTTTLRSCRSFGVER
jgi:hypothetical protein